MCVERIQVDAQSSTEQDGILRDDGESRAEWVQAKLGDVLTVDDDGSTSGLDDSEQSKSQARLSSSSSAHNSNFLSALNSERDST